MSKIKIICRYKKCSKEFQTQQCWVKRGQGKFCSNKCKNDSLIGIPQKRESVEKRSKQITGKNNGRWMGDLVSKTALHCWIHKYHGRANRCENREIEILGFKCSEVSNFYHWANKKPYLYTRNINTWMQLCVSCHQKYDMTDERRARSKRVALRDIIKRERNLIGQFI